MYLDIDNNIHKDISESNYTDYITKQPLLTWGPLERINILVGANNSGKSRFLRSLIKSKGFVLLNSLQIKDWENQLKDTLKNCINTLEIYGKYIDYIINPPTKSNFTRPLAINEDHKNICVSLAETGKPKSVILDSKYFNYLLGEVDTFFIHKGTFEGFKNKIELIRAELNIAMDIIDPKKRDVLGQAIESNTIRTSAHLQRHPDKLTERIKNVIKLFEDFKNFEVQLVIPENKIYIPILRSAISLFEENQESNSRKKIEQDIFRLTIENTYKIDIKEDASIRIETGLDLYKSIRKIRNNVKEIRRGFEDFEAFLSKTFFNNEAVDIVAREGEKHEEDHLILYIGGEERSIHDLGDGIQSLIILMYPIFTAPKGSWIFIEEPEINLHPGFQRIFLNQLVKNKDLIAKDIKIFFTTHSNHLLDLSLEIDEGVSIFTFEKKPNNDKDCHEIKNVKNSDIDILSKLGVNNSSVFMANCSLWVEGISDRYILRAFLKAFCKQHKDEKKFAEDIHYSFFEYAGSNVAHYFFSEDKELIDDLKENENIKAQFLNNRIFLLADKDHGKESKHNKFLAQIGSNFHYQILNCREIENILSPTQLKKYLPRLISKLSENIVSKIDFDPSDYQVDYLGNYLESKFAGKLPKGFKADSGTLSTYYKTKLAELILSDIEWDEMSKDAQNLTREIYSFIKNSNK